MDELKQRIEYLESITQGPENEENLLEQVDRIGLALNTMVDVHKNEAERLADEVNRQTTHHSQPNAQPASTPKASAPNDTDHSSSTSSVSRADSHSSSSSDPQLTTEIKSGIVVSRFEELEKLTNELEMEAPLEVPESAPRPNMEDLVAEATVLGREFDELTLRSATLTKKLSDKIVEDNKK